MIGPLGGRHCYDTASSTWEAVRKRRVVLNAKNETPRVSSCFRKCIDRTQLRQLSGMLVKLGNLLESQLFALHPCMTLYPSVLFKSFGSSQSFCINLAWSWILRSFMGSYFGISTPSTSSQPLMLLRHCFRRCQLEPESWRRFDPHLGYIVILQTCHKFHTSSTSWLAKAVKSFFFFFSTISKGCNS